MRSIGAERELYNRIIGRLWPREPALLRARRGIPDHDRVAISAGREPLAVRAEHKRSKTPAVDCRKHLVWRARTWRDLWRRDFFCGHAKLRSARRCLLSRLLCMRYMSTKRQRKNTRISTTRFRTWLTLTAA